MAQTNDGHSPRRWAGLLLWAALALIGVGLLLLAWPARPEAAAISPVTPLPHGSPLQSHRVVATISLGLGIGQGTQAAAFNPVNGLVYVTNSDSDDVSIIRGTDVITMVVVGGEPNAVAANPRTGLVYVANEHSCDVSVFSGTRVIATVPLLSVCPGGYITLGDLVAHPTTGLVYVANYYSDTIAVFSRTDVITTLATAADPWALAVQPRTGLVYAVDSTANQVTVLSGTAVVATVPVGDRPGAVDADPVTGLVYVANYQGGSVSILSGTAVITSVAVGPSPMDVAANPVTGLVYVASYSGGTVTVLTGTKVLTTVNVGIYPAHIAADPVTGLVYAGTPAVAISGTQVVAQFPDIPVTDVTFNSVSGEAYLVGQGQATVLTGATRMAHIAGAPTPAGLLVHPDSGWVYVAGGNSDRVYVLSDTQVISAVPTGDSPSAMAVHPGNGLVYVANYDGYGGGSVSILSRTEVLTTVGAGRYPRAVEVNPATGLVYVANGGSDTVTVLSGTAVVTTVPALEPVDIAANPATGLVYAIPRMGGYSGAMVTVLSATEVYTTVRLQYGGEFFWLQDVEVHPASGWAYVADGQGKVWFISGTTSLGYVPVPGSATRLGIQTGTGLVYAMGSGGGHGYIAALSGTAVITTAVVGYDLAGMALHPSLGYIYLTAPVENAVAVMVGTRVVERVPAGRYPRPIVVHPATGRVYVGNYDDYSVSVLESALPYRLYLPLVTRRP